MYTRAAWRTSAFASKITFGLATKLVYATFWGTSLVMALPYFKYFATGEVVHGRSMQTASNWSLDPARDGYGLFIPFVILTAPLIILLVLRPFAWRDARKAYAREVDWVATLPFTMTNYPDALGNDGSELCLDVEFQDRANKARLHSLISEIDGRIETHAKGNHAQIRLGTTHIRSSERGPFWVRTVHGVVDAGLTVVHAENPIASVNAS